MASDHSAFFGNHDQLAVGKHAHPGSEDPHARRERLQRTLTDNDIDPLSLFAQARAQAGDETGIPADLVPYLREAALSDEDDPQETSHEAAHHKASREEAERTQALRDLVANSILLGPDPSIMQELTDDEDFADDQEEALSDNGGHEAALDRAQADLDAKNEADAIYQDIIKRAPEHKVQPSLDRMNQVLNILGDPQNTYPTVHVTGTNGKTSAARMVDALLREMGLQVGLFTSPHLVDVRERIQIDGAAISRPEFIAAWKDVAPYIDMVDQASADQGGPRMSFFEAFTTMAYAAFADHPVDAAVIEVGMGGLWDATNVIDSTVSVIMPIGLDHQKWLGSTLTQIAHEKAGIIKPHQTVVVARQPEEALSVIMERAKDLDAIVRLEGRDFDIVRRDMGVGGQMVTVQTPAATYEDVFVPLFGAHQAQNAAAALVAAEAFMGGQALDGRLVERGFMNVISPGRLQVVHNGPEVLVDGGHNPAAAQVVAEALEDSFAFEHVYGIYSAMADKDIEGVLSIMEPVLDELIVTQMGGDRAADVDHLHKAATSVFGADRVEVREDLPDAIDRGIELAQTQEADPLKKSGVLIFGSLHLAGDALRLFGKDAVPERGKHGQ